MLRPREDKALSLKQQIEVLYGLGIGPSDIAEILGKTSGHINKELSVSGIRKRRNQEKLAWQEPKSRRRMTCCATC